MSTKFNNEQFFVVCGETGSGKSTQLPQYYYNTFLRTGSGRIIVVQPRKVAALSIAKRIAEELGVQLGNEVGYDLGSGKENKNFNFQQTKILLMAEKQFLQKSIKEFKKQGSSFLNHTYAVLLDEVHERSLTIDLLMGILKQNIPKYKTKVIICSATIDTSKFSKFFNNCPILEIPGKTYPVQIQYALQGNSEDYIEETSKALINVITQKLQGRKEYEGHILVFLISLEDMEQAKHNVSNFLKSKQIENDYVLLYLHGKLEQEEQQKVFNEYEYENEAKNTGQNQVLALVLNINQNKKYKTKIIFSTKVAESSVTINGIKIVVDSG